MNVFGIGPMELILILVIALIVFGPGKMPEMGRSLGAAIREFRRASQELTNELTREVDLSQLKELKEEVKSIQTEMTQAVPYQVGRLMAEPERTVTEGAVAEPAHQEAEEPAAQEGVHEEPVAIVATAPREKSLAQRAAARRAAAKRRENLSRG